MLNLIKNKKGEVLNLFFQDVGREYYLREIAKNLGKEPGHYQKIINDLVKEGILEDRRRGNMRFFKLNKDYPLYQELKKIISKTIGIEGRLKELVGGFKDIKCAFIFGSIAKEKETTASDIDLMLIGEIDHDILIQKVSQLEAELNREINYHIYGYSEAINKLKEKNNFFINVFRQPTIVLKGDLYDFKKFY
ncbi:hypothetical protein COV49_04225 [Candidatus Falkowbacteria bacterium CG11_big_fil_rev_8_21_14_0_20_39_10]|uniref:Polymerase beta nucleotidyltransferase domain-containing protein n=1 Tax=Candidatus Falkowbacteria bacterium CG11_big_fil_rev_8_21_14_0_20_39_10 TaxID=1974570 RepID=A0A2M6K805_9BACT|nr:MAG: hypothetical protein COV49_04225 [Candidatus Falkowbacteria bacterium CG11_big_fil_rev_8_21_14_0_20_39_10]